MRQPGHDGQVRADARFIAAGRQVSSGTEVDAWPLTTQALLLIPQAMDPDPLRECADPLRECADRLLVDRWRGRSDCGGVHQASEIPAARAVTSFPASAAIPLASPYHCASNPPDLRRLEYSSRSAGAHVARPTIKWSSLYDLDFFWMTRVNHCNLD